MSIVRLFMESIWLSVIKKLILITFYVLFVDKVTTNVIPTTNNFEYVGMYIHVHTIIYSVLTI